MNKSYHLGLIYNMLAIAGGIGAYHFFSEGKWFSALLFILLMIVFVALMYYSFFARTSKAEKIISAVRKKDFSLFPRMEGIRCLITVSVCIIKAKRNSFLYRPINSSMKVSWIKWKQD